MKVLAIDPGNVNSAYCVLDADTLRPLDFDILPNEQLRHYIRQMTFAEEDRAAIEMVASYGMAVGREVFDTVRWIGRYEETLTRLTTVPPTLIYRMEEKTHICHDSRAKDSNIRRALIDRFAKHDFRFGRGTKKRPGLVLWLSKGHLGRLCGRCGIYRHKSERIVLGGAIIMTESNNFPAYKKKLQGVCDEHDLVYQLRVREYPISLTIRPTKDMDGQISMLEQAEDKGFTSPDASLTFYLKDGNITYATTEQFTISETLFNKLKNLFRHLYGCWLQYFFRYMVEEYELPEKYMPVIEDSGQDTIPEDAEPIEAYEEDREDEDPDESGLETV